MLRSETKTKQSTLTQATDTTQKEIDKQELSWRHGRSIDFGSLRVWSGRAYFKQTLKIDLNSSDARTVFKMFHRAFLLTIILSYISVFWGILGHCQEPHFQQVVRFPDYWLNVGTTQALDMTILYKLWFHKDYLLPLYCCIVKPRTNIEESLDCLRLLAAPAKRPAENPIFFMERCFSSDAASIVARSKTSSRYQNSWNNLLLLVPFVCIVRGQISPC